MKEPKGSIDLKGSKDLKDSKDFMANRDFPRGTNDFEKMTMGLNLSVGV